MFTGRRWWDRIGSRIMLLSLTLGTAWLVRQTGGAAIYELYHLAARPFQSSPTQAQRLASAEVLELQQRVTELENQNQKLQSLLGYVGKQTQEAIVAPIIGRSADHWWEQVTLGRGSRDGIEVGFVVVGIGGLVGRVVSVTPNTSLILLVSDPTSQVGVSISRSRDMGFMQGRDSRTAVIQFFEKLPDVRVGDTVTTSSVSRLFPAGLPVGRIKSIDLEKSPAPEAVLEITSPVGDLEWVAVHPFQPQE